MASLLTPPLWRTIQTGTTYSNAGMGVCLTMAEETGAYILSDKATFLTFQTNNGVME